MCCRRRRNQPSAAPLIAVAATTAYQKYQQHKQQKAIANEQGRALPGVESNVPQPYTDLSEKAGMEQPPSYNELVANRAILPEPQVNIDEKAKIDPIVNAVGQDVPRMMDGDQIYGVPNGMQYSNVPAANMPGMPVNAQYAGMSSCQSRCEQKKAAKAAMKAEKRAAKLARKQRCGGC